MERSNSPVGLLMATARFHHHVRVLFEDYVVAVVEVENRDGRELGGRAARLGYHCRVHEVHQSLHDGVVGSVHLRAEGKRTFSETEESRVSLRRNDPVLPPKPLEADVQHSTTAALFAGALEVSANVGELRSEGTRRATSTRFQRVKPLIRHALFVAAVERD